MPGVRKEVEARAREGERWRWVDEWGRRVDVGVKEGAESVKVLEEGGVECCGAREDVRRWWGFRGGSERSVGNGGVEVREEVFPGGVPERVVRGRAGVDVDWGKRVCGSMYESEKGGEIVGERSGRMRRRRHWPRVEVRRCSRPVEDASVVGLSNKRDVYSTDERT